MKKALITGLTGQDGAYLAEFLLNKGYEVHGVKRRSSSFNTSRIDHLCVDPHEKNSKFHYYFGDLTDSANIIRIIQEVQPDELYNLGAMSHVQVSFEMPEYTANTNALGTLRILEAIRLLGLIPKTKFYQASSSELYGKVFQIPQNENTPFYPRSPYGVSKLFAYWITVNYREAYNMFAVNGILFNHESPIRGETFVTRKITRGVARVVLNLQDKIYLGNLDAKRDWGHARDYIEAMWLMLQQERPDDFVIATGLNSTVRDFVIKSYKETGVDIIFEGKGETEVGIVDNCHNPEFKLTKGKIVVAVDKHYYRPTEVDILLGDSSKARNILNWKPTHNLDTLIKEMVQSDLKIFRKDKLLKEKGHKILDFNE